jgi:hypothetical protein
MLAAAGGPPPAAAPGLAHFREKRMSNVTWITPAYLQGLANALGIMLDDVTNQVDGVGNVTTSTGNVVVQAVDSTLNITEPGGSGGTDSTFPLALDLNTKLGNVGNSVNEDVTWLQTLLEDMIQEINTTISSMKTTDNLNADSIQSLENDFSQTLSDMTSGPGSSGSGGSGQGGG